MVRKLNKSRHAVLVLLLAVVSLSAVRVAPASGLPEKVLILASTVTGGASSVEATKAAALGYTVDVVSDVAWSAKTASDFASYRAIILGDPTCRGGGGNTSPYLNAALANRSVWGPQIDGNVVINGTDPVYHNGQGGNALTGKGIAFATDAPGKTGAYISLSCYYHGVASGTPVPLLDVFNPGGFKMTGVGCYNNVRIVASHPALVGLTDANLSNWGCSVHEAFVTWPSDFTVLAIAAGIGSAYTAADGTKGTPYILARGEGLSASDISLTPASASNPVGSSHTLKALVTRGGSALSGQNVTFTVLSGPHIGTMGAGVTDAAGIATFTYTGTVAGIDTLEASFVSSPTVTQKSNEVTAEWTKVANTPPNADAGGPYTVPEGGSVTLDASASSDLEGDPLTYAWDLDNDGTFEMTGAAPSFSAAGMDGPGVAPIVLKVCDPSGECSKADTVVKIHNVAPSVHAGADQTVFRNEVVNLAGTFTDPAGGLDNPYGWSWLVPGSPSSGSANYGDTIARTATFATEGTYTLGLNVTDKDGDSGSDELVMTVQNRAPECGSAAPSIATIWPPNHQFVNVTITGVTDAEGDTLTTTITGIHQDELVDSTGDGRFAPDGAGVGTSTAEVRAERAGTPKAPGNGRVYHIGFSVDDGHGGTCSGTVRVGVPHDQRGAAAVDDGALHSSTL